MAITTLAMAGCEDFLDRPQKSDLDDNNYWSSESNVRLFVNGNYSNYFVGYNSGWGSAYTVLRGYDFCDDFVSSNKQRGFSVQAPADNWAKDEKVTWLSEFAGQKWNFAWVRKHNILIQRLNAMKENNKLTEEEYNHWMGVARFFRGYEYSRLVETFGDVPYYDTPVRDTDWEAQYKDRDSRMKVMDAVYEDFEFALNNIRENDGANYLNRYIAAGFISRLMLFEGTWYKYHEGSGDNEHAKKFLEQAVRAGDYVINSGKFGFNADFRSLFGSFSPAGMNEVMMYRYYSDDPKVRHCVASYSNLTESQGAGPNLALAKSFICNDGKAYQNSGVENARKFDHKSLAATRDPRFEATFWDEPNAASSSLLYACKFIDRKGVTYYGGTYPPEYGSSTNINGYPVMRYAEVVLNWIEAKAELAESFGGAAVQQGDIDKSINAIRKRPLDDAAKSKGVKQTAPLQLSALSDNFDPARDKDIPALIWEIRRERRMEFVFEHTRMADIRRWHKLDYMDGDKNPDLLRGIWVDFNETQEGKITTSFDFLTESKIGTLQVVKEDGTIVTYDGKNKSEMKGYYVPNNVQNRDKFGERNYLSPICTDVINMYKDKGYTITQNQGW